MKEVSKQWFDRLRCPRCNGKTIQGTRSVSCTDCETVYPITDDIALMVLPEDMNACDRFCSQYDALRLKEGWASDLPDYYESLPFHDLAGLHSDHWKLRTNSYRLIDRWLRRIFDGARRMVLDGGAGNGWLSKLLAKRHDVAALDLNAGRHGLGAIPKNRRTYAAIQAGLERMPLVDECCDVVIINASLHYGQAPDRYLQETHRILVSNGFLFITDSPVYPTESGADQARERTQAYYEEAGFPELAKYYCGLTDACFDAHDLFQFQRLRRDFSRTELIKKRVREALGSPESARFPVWVGRKE